MQAVVEVLSLLAIVVGALVVFGAGWALIVGGVVGLVVSWRTA